MNIVSFLDLIYQIFGKSVPNIKKIEKKGLLAIKIGQIFALRIDFLTPEKCELLATLYEQNEVMPNEDFKKLLSSYIEDSWYLNFNYIEEYALASASIGQVHRGELKSGEKVVIKLVKNEFTHNFQKDVNQVLKFFKMIIFIYPKLSRVANPMELIEMIKSDTLSELDLENEIKHQNILKEIYFEFNKKVDLNDLRFPKIYQDLSNDKVLVAEEIRGDTFEKLLQNGKLKYFDLKKLFRIHGFYMFGVGIFHGDLHPGNIILKDGNIYFVDCGAIGRVSNKLRVGLFNFMKHLSYYEFEECANNLHSMSDIEITKEKYDLFKEKLNKLYEDFPGKTVKEKSLTSQMMETIKLGVNYGMSFEKGIFPIIKSLMYLDGMVLRCNPNAILMEDMRENIPELEKIIKEEGDGLIWRR